MSATDDPLYRALLAWAEALPHGGISVPARVGDHTGYLSVERTRSQDGSVRVAVRVRDSRKGARHQYRGVIPHHLADGSHARFQIKAPNGRYIDWTPDVELPL